MWVAPMPDRPARTTMGSCAGEGSVGVDRSSVQWLASAVLVAAVVGGCASPGPAASVEPGGKAGGKPGPITITVADSQFPGRPSNLPLDELKRQVESGSAGAISVEILTTASADADPPHS